MTDAHLIAELRKIVAQYERGMSTRDEMATDIATELVQSVKRLPTGADLIRST